MSFTTLGELAENERCRVIGYSEKSEYRRQLLSLGLTPGTEITMVRKAPLGDPIEFELLGFTLCLRRDEANCVRVQKTGK